MFFSKLTVSSRSTIFFSFLFTRTILGLCAVVTISAGIVPPFIDFPAISAKIVASSDFRLIINRPGVAGAVL